MTFECQFCHREFKREQAFLQHSCPRRERHDLLQSPLGQSAYACYEMWMRGYKRKVPPIETFADSRYFKSFVEFARFASKVHLTNVESYIRLMIQKDISPLLWTRSECYSLYLDHLDRGISPLKAIEISVETLLSLQAKRNLSALSDVIMTMPVSELIHHVMLRTISPWLLLCSGTFKRYLSEKSSAEVSELMNVISPEVWASRLDAAREDVLRIKEITQELGLNS